MRTLHLTLALLIFLALPFALTQSVKAVSASPASGTVARNTSFTVNLTATPPAGATGVQVRLTITGATVTGYTRPTTNWIGLPTCGNGQDYDATHICVDLAKTSGNITSGESLGTITLLAGSSGTITITKDSGNAYSVGGSPQANTGVAATFTIGDTTNLPNTAITLEGKDLIIAGAVMIIVAALGWIGYEIYKMKHANLLLAEAIPDEITDRS